MRSHARFLLAALLLVGLSAGAWAESSLYGQDRTASNLAHFKKTTKYQAGAGGGTGGGGGGGPRVPAAPPAEIVIVTQPPQCNVSLETGTQVGNPETKPDASRFKFKVSSGNRKLVVSKEGWQKRELVIEIKPGENSPILVKLDTRDYEGLFKELIQVYQAKYDANRDDGNALLHLLYLNRLMKNYREVDRLTEELQNNPRIDVREETKKLERLAKEVMAAEAAATEGEGGEGGDDIATRLDVAPTLPEGTNAEEAQLANNHFFYPGMVGYLQSAHLERPDFAMEYLKAAVRAEFDVALLWYDIGVALSKQGEIQDAYLAMQQAENLDVDHAWIMAEMSYLSNLYGQMIEDDRITADAEYYAQEAIEEDPGYIGGYMNLITYYQMEGRLDLALQQVNIAMPMFPDEPLLHGVAGDIYRGMRQPDAAAAAYNAALALQPDYSYGLYGLGQIAEGEGNIDQAKSYYLQAAASGEDFVEPLIRAAWLEQNHGDPNAALDLYHRVIQENPELFDPWYQSGVIYYDNEMFDKAATYLYEAFRLNPFEPWTQYRLGDISRRKGDQQKGLDFFSGFLEVYSGDDDFSKDAQAYVNFQMNINGRVPSKYAGEGGAGAGDPTAFLNTFFAEDESGSSDGGDLGDNFKPEFLKDDAPERGGLKAG